MFIEEKIFKRMVIKYIWHTYDYGIEMSPGEMSPTLYNHQRSSIFKLHKSRRWNIYRSLSTATHKYISMFTIETFYKYILCVIRNSSKILG